MIEIFDKLSQNLISILIIVFASIVHATVQLKLARENKDSDFKTADFIILLPISAFAGLIFGLMSSLFFTSEVAVWLSSGIGSFLGIAGLNRISTAFLEFLVDKAKKK